MSPSAWCLQLRRCRRTHRGVAHPSAVRAFRASRRWIARRCAVCCAVYRMLRTRTGCRVSRRRSAHRGRRAACGRRRARRARPERAVDRSRTRGASLRRTMRREALFDRGAWSSRGRRPIPGSRFVALQKCSRTATAVRSAQRTSKDHRCSASPRVRTVEELPTVRWDSCSCARTLRQTRSIARVRNAWDPGRVPHLGGIRRSGGGGQAAECDPESSSADEIGLLLAGPNWQGVVSTPSSLCAQIVARIRRPGASALGIQSGNFVSSFLNWSRQTGVGVSRAVSAGNAGRRDGGDYLASTRARPHTAWSLAYVEGVGDGHAFYAVRGAPRRKPSRAREGWRNAGGHQRAAASHTGRWPRRPRVRRHGAPRRSDARARSKKRSKRRRRSRTQPLPKVAHRRDDGAGGEGRGTPTPIKHF